MHKIFKLNNGLKVVTEYIEHVNSVSVGVMVQNGSRNEKPEENGISHFIEHMFFKGTKKRTAKKIFEEIENVGGQINAFTSKEATCYYIKSLNTHLDLALDVLSDMILNSNFNEEEIEKEKGVVIEEINMSEDTPEDVLEGIFSRGIFGDNELAYPILGTVETVKTFTSAQIKKYVQQKYTPTNSVISICGKFEEETIINELEAYFGSWKQTDYTPIYEKPLLCESLEVRNKEIEQVHVALGLQGLPMGSKDGYTLLLLNNILGGGASSILFQKVREELGLCYTIYSYSQGFVEGGIFNIYTGVSKKYLKQAIEAIYEELHKFCENGITEEQLKINKEKIKASYLLGLESTSSRMFANAKSYLFRNRVKTQEKVIEQIDKITLEDTKRVIRECFGKGVICKAFVGNGLDKEELNIFTEKDKIAYNNSCLNSKINL